jgi:hypothetical protein
VWSGPSFAAQVRRTDRSRPAGSVAAVELDRVALAIGEAEHLDARKALQRPGKGDGGILAAGEEDEGAGMVMRRPQRPGSTCRAIAALR